MSYLFVAALPPFSLGSCLSHTRIECRGQSRGSSPSVRGVRENPETDTRNPPSLASGRATPIEFEANHGQEAATLPVPPTQGQVAGHTQITRPFFSISVQPPQQLRNDPSLSAFASAFRWGRLARKFFFFFSIFAIARWDLETSSPGLGPRLPTEATWASITGQHGLRAFLHLGNHKGGVGPQSEPPAPRHQPFRTQFRVILRREKTASTGGRAGRSLPW